MRHAPATFGRKKHKSRNFSHHFIVAFFFSFNSKKTPKLAETPIFKCFGKPKKENFQKMNLKHRKLKNPIFAPFFEKGYF